MLQDGSESLVGIYSLGGGRSGTIRALEESRLLAYICHQLIRITRSGLTQGIDAVLDQDVTQLSRSALKMLIETKAVVRNQHETNAYRD